MDNMKTENRYSRIWLILLAIGVLILGRCEQSYDVEVNVQEINRTAGITISYRINNGNETSLGTTNNSGTLNSNIQGLKGNYRITLIARKPGYKVAIVSPKFPININSKQRVINTKLQANPNEKKIRITSTPPTSGIKTLLDDGRGGSASSETNNSGNDYISLKSVDWSSVKFSFSHPDYFVSSKSEGQFIDFNYIPTAIRLSIFPKRDLNYNLKIVNPIDGRPIIGAAVAVVGSDNEYLTRIDGSVQIPATTSFLVEEDLIVGSELLISIEKVGYAGLTVKYLVSNDFSNPDRAADIIQLQPANELTIKVYDKGGRTLAGIPISIQGSETKTTNKSGKILYKYEAKRAGEKILVSISEENILPFQKEIILSAIDKTETLVISPYSYYLEVRNKASHASVDNIEVIASADVSVTYLESGMVQLLFRAINTVYSIRVLDGSGNYETASIELDINADNLGESTVVDLLPKTFIKFKIKDQNNEPLSDVTIVKSNTQFGKTKSDGVLRREITYSADPIAFSIGKSQFKSINMIKYVSPGENLFTVEMTKLEMIVTVVDNETKMVIPHIDIKINKTKYTTDSGGQIIFNPKSDNSEIILENSGSNGVYLKSKTDHKYDSDANSSAKFYLQPRPAIIVKTIFVDPNGMKGEISGVNLTIEGEKIGLTDIDGFLTIQLNEIGNDFTIRADKKGFISDSIYVPNQRPTIYRTEIVLQGITAFINVHDVSYNKIEGLSVTVDGSYPSQTNNWGQAVVRLSELNKNVTIRISDPKNRYVSKSIEHIFNQPKDAIDVTLLPRPVDLTVTVGYSNGSPAIANIEILPPPTNTGDTMFKLSAGSVTIPVYKAGTYEVKYTTQTTFITGSELVKVELGVNEIRIG